MAGPGAPLAPRGRPRKVGRTRFGREGFSERHTAPRAARGEQALRRRRWPCTRWTSRSTPGAVIALVGDNGAGKSTLIKCVAGIYRIDGGEILFDGQPVQHPRADATRPPSGSRSSTRTSRWRTTSTSSRTCSSGARSSSRSARSTRSRWSRARATTLGEPLGHHHPQRAPDGRRPLGRPAPVGGGRQGGDVELARRDPRRAHRRPRRGPDAAGARPGQAPRRAGARGGASISHNLHDIFEVADDITVLRLGQNVAEFKRTEATQEEVVQAITAGKLSKVPGQVDTDEEEVVGVTTAEATAASGRPAALRGRVPRWWTDVKSGRARLAADHHRPDHHRDRLPVAERPLPHRQQLRQPDRPVGGLRDDRHGHRLRAAAGRDRPVGRLRLGRGGRDRRGPADPRRQRGADVDGDRRSRSAGASRSAPSTACCSRRSASRRSWSRSRG